MPRSTRHKSSKHSSRDYSDSEKDVSSKDRRSSREDGSRVKISKESASGEKRKLHCNYKGSGNGDYLEAYPSSSKRRKERDEDVVNDRWSGGDGDNRSERKKLKEKSSSESRSKRRDESAGGVHEDIEQMPKKSSGKSDGRHRESTTQKEEKERDRRVKEMKSDIFTDGDDLRIVKQVSDRIESNVRDLLLNPESENLLDGQIRRKRDGFGNGNKHQNDIGDNNDRRLSSKEDIAKDGRMKDEKYKDKHSEYMVKESRHQDDKHQDECAAKYHVNSRSDDMRLRDKQNTAATRLKKYKPQDGDHDHVCEHHNDRDHDYNCEIYQRHQDHGHDWDHDREGNLDRKYDWDCDQDGQRDADQDREQDHNHDGNLDYDGVHMDDRGARYKHSGKRKISPEDHEDSNDAKARGKTSNLEVDRKSSSSNRVESDIDQGKPQSRQACSDYNRRRASPNSLQEAADEYRQFKQVMMYRDTVREQRSKSVSRETTNMPGSSDLASKYRSSVKLTKMDDGNSDVLAVEKPSSSKASPRGLVHRSPSSSSLEHSRYKNRFNVSQSVEIEEADRRCSASMGARDLSPADDRPSRDKPLDKSLADESISADSSFNNKNIQSNSALIPPSAFRGGVGSPFLGSLEEDGRINTGARSKRNGDPQLGRGQGNAWRDASNWSSPVPNCYIPFHHGPLHGSFQAMVPQFPSPLLGIRPSMEVNHSGIPYHFAEVDRFPTHLYPLAWQNMMDGSGPSQMHGWDGNNGVFRDKSHMYRGAEWDQNRHPFNGRKWESGADIWKGRNGDLNLKLPSASLNEDFSNLASVNGMSVGQRGERSQKESNHLGVQLKTVETKLVVTSPTKEFPESSPKTVDGKTSDPPKLSSLDNVTYVYHVYLSKLDISVELTDPEVYNQIMSLVNMEQSATVDEGTAMLLNLKDGARAVPKSSPALLTSSLLPMTSDSVFQRSMDIYERQRQCLSNFLIVNDGMVDVIAASGVEEQTPDDNLDMLEKQILNHGEEIADERVNLDEKKALAVPVADLQEILDVASCQEVDVVAHTPDLKLELSGHARTDDILEKPMIILNGDKDEVSSQLADSEGPQDRDYVSAPNDVANAAKVGHADGNKINGISKGSNSFNRAEVVQAFGDVRCGPLLLKEGAAKASTDLIPGSNESESVIVSRIYHSPESTH